MPQPIKHSRGPSTTFWVLLIIILLILNAGLALIVLRGFMEPVAQSAPDPSATPTAPSLPGRTPVARLPLATRGPTRTPRPRPTIQSTRVRPSPQATPDTFLCTETSGQTTDEMYSSRVSGSDQRYIVYLPPCYDFTTIRYPTLYLIHGMWYDATHWESLGILHAMDEGLQTKQWGPAIIVLAEGDENLFANTSGGAESFEAQIIQELVPAVDHLFRTDPRPEMRAIGGISRGGVWSLEIGFLHPEMFGIVGGHSACLNLNESPPEFDPLKITDMPTLKSQHIWLDAGDEDDCLPGTEELDAALNQSGVAHRYEIWPGRHEDAYWAEHLADYLAFYTQTWLKP